MRNPSYKFFIQETEEKTSVSTTITPLSISLPTNGYLHYINGTEYASSSSYISNYVEIAFDCDVSWEESTQIQVVQYDSSKKIIKVFNGYDGKFKATKGQFFRVSSIYNKVEVTETQTEVIHSPATYREVFPIYKDIKIQADKENNQMFFRKKIYGKFTFLRSDFEYINSKEFEFEFILVIRQSFDGKTWNDFAKGKFFKTDGEWNPVDKVVRISCRICDDYEDVINNLDKEFDLIQLLPKIENVGIHKSAALQTYVLGSDTIGYYHNGIYWEDSVNQSVKTHDEITGYGFQKVGTYCAVHYDNLKGHSYASQFDGDYWGKVDNDGQDYLLQTNNSKCKAYYNNRGIYLCTKAATDKSQAMKYFNGVEWYERDGLGAPWIKEFYYQADTDIFDVYNRLLVAKGASYTHPIPLSDIATDNRNYRYYMDISPSNKLYAVSLNRTKTPTKYGKVDSENYFAEPTGIGTYYPIAKSTWVTHSLWINTEYLALPSVDTLFTLKHAYTLSSIISKFLEKTTSLKHDETCSKFLYERLSDAGKKITLLITPKSNLLHGNYDTPAQKCVTSLKTILEALRDMFRCYWYVEDGFLKIEHEEFFRNGYSYDIDSRNVIDLDNIISKPNQKSWGFGQYEYSYDLSDMPQRMTFSWMDKVTSKFDSNGIDVLSKFVDEGQNREISVNSITTDVDYLTLCPNSVNEDGMVMLSAVRDSEGLELAHANGAQNGILSWNYLVKNFYSYAFPSRRISLDGVMLNVLHTSLNCKQKMKIPYISSFSEKSKIKSRTIYAEIEKYSISLQSLIIEVNLAYEQ